MHVDHAADHSAPFEAQVPVMCGVVVNPEWYREEKDEVCKNEVEDSGGRDGCGGGLHNMRGQTQADETADKNHNVNAHKNRVVVVLM